MATQLNIRVPDDLREWIKDESYEQRMSQNKFALSLLTKARTVGEVPTLFDNRPLGEVVLPDSIPFRFVDLFAGIGGFRVGLTAVGGRCVWTCEYDRFSQTTYKAWFSEDSIYGDINDLDSRSAIDETIPDHDMLAAGFPCQPFSIAGVSKKKSLGMAHGFECKKQGNLFFKIAEIVKVKRPPVLFLENVKNLRSHDKGRTWQVIYNELDRLGYEVNSSIVDAASYVPQHRERFLIVCFDKEVFKDGSGFEFPLEQPRERSRRVLGDILEEDRLDGKYILTDHLWSYLRKYAEKHRKKGNGFGFGLVGKQDQTRTLSARYYKDGSEILIRPPTRGWTKSLRGEKGKKNPRRLTPREAAQLMGFDAKKARMFGHVDGFPIVVSDTQAYKQFGNAVVPAVVESVGRNIVKVMARRVAKGCLLRDRHASVAAAQRV